MYASETHRSSFSGCLDSLGDLHTYSSRSDAPSQIRELADIKSLAAILEACSDENVLLLTMEKIQHSTCDPSNYVLVHQAGLIPSIARLADGQTGAVQSAALSIMIALLEDAECCKAIAQLQRPAARATQPATPPIQQSYSAPATHVPEPHCGPSALSLQAVLSAQALPSHSASSIASEERTSTEGEHEPHQSLRPFWQRRDNGHAPRNHLRRRWQVYEDVALMHAVQRVGCCWPKVAAIVGGRTVKQCRERWKNHLQDGVRKDVWSADEKQRFKELFEKHGPRWATIAKHMPGRSDSAVKNFAVYSTRKTS